MFALTRKGRVETTNYRTVKLPSDVEIPEYLKNEFAPFYQAMFAKQVEEHDMKAVFLEYAWDMSWCDPCAADPLTGKELRELGVFWVDGGDVQPGPGPRPLRPIPAPQPGGQNVFVTRLHVRYDARHFPEDLVFQATGDRQNFQGRYVMRHPFTGSLDCEAGRRYRETVRERQAREASTLASLTGWDLGEIRRKMKLGEDGGAPVSTPEEPWYERIWAD